jgi:hypothetical protein
MVRIWAVALIWESCSIRCAGIMDCLQMSIESKGCKKIDRPGITSHGRDKENHGQQLTLFMSCSPLLGWTIWIIYVGIGYRLYSYRGSLWRCLGFEYHWYRFSNIWLENNIHDRSRFDQITLQKNLKKSSTNTQCCIF